MTGELHLPSDIHLRKERKHWEWAMGFYAFQHYGSLSPSKSALGIACGHEAIMYALTNHLRSVTGIDLYGETRF